MDDLTAKNQIESLFYEVLEDYLPGGIGQIEKTHIDPDAWEAEISECNSYLYVLKKRGLIVILKYLFHIKGEARYGHLHP